MRKARCEQMSSAVPHVWTAPSWDEAHERIALQVGQRFRHGNQRDAKTEQSRPRHCRGIAHNNCFVQRGWKLRADGIAHDSVRESAGYRRTQNNAVELRAFYPSGERARAADYAR